MPSAENERRLQDRINQLDNERIQVKSQLDRERLVRVTNGVIETITSPEFIERMQQARMMADSSEGYDAVAKLLTLESLRAAGAEIPDDFRLTSRVFEDKVNGVRFELKSDLTGIPGLEPLGWGACGGAGGLTFCGCGGFST
jgi:hypothetical protein